MVRVEPGFSSSKVVFEVVARLLRACRRRRARRGCRRPVGRPPVRRPPELEPDEHAVSASVRLADADGRDETVGSSRWGFLP